MAASTPSRSTVCQHHLGAQTGVLAQFQEADAAAEFAVLGQIAARLTHQPDRHALGSARGGRPSSAGCRARQAAWRIINILAPVRCRNEKGLPGTDIPGRPVSSQSRSGVCS